METTDPQIERQQRLACAMEGANLTQALSQAVRMVDELGDDSVEIVTLKRYTSFSIREIGEEDARPTTGWEVTVSNWKVNENE